MLENNWKAKLVRVFKKSRPMDFIWANEARLKSGFPDLYLLKSGAPIHVELKSIKGTALSLIRSRWAHYIKPLQLELLKRIKDAGAHSYLIIKFKTDDEVGVLVVRIKDGRTRSYSDSEFLDVWKSPRVDLILPEV